MRYSRRSLLALASMVAGIIQPGAAIALQPQSGRVEGSVHLDRRPATGAVVFLIPEDARNYDPPEEAVVIDQVDLRFHPQTVAILPRTRVDFPNSDPILHNVFSPRGPGAGFNLGTYPPGETRSHHFEEHGVHVILCHVHPEMVAYVVVVPSEHRTVVAADGSFAIENVPAGRYAVRVWHARRPALVRSVVVPAGGVGQIHFRPGR